MMEPDSSSRGVAGNSAFVGRHSPLNGATRGESALFSPTVTQHKGHASHALTEEL